MADEKPPGYPFQRDEIVWSSHYNDFDPDSNSYLAVAKLPEDHTVKINGKTHTNSHRLVIHSPMRGTESFLINPSADGQGLLSAALVVLAEDDAKRGGKGVASFNPEFFERKTGVEIPFVPGDEP